MYILQKDFEQCMNNDSYLEWSGFCGLGQFFGSSNTFGFLAVLVDEFALLRFLRFHFLFLWRLGSLRGATVTACAF